MAMLAGAPPWLVTLKLANTPPEEAPTTYAPEIAFAVKTDEVATPLALEVA